MQEESMRHVYILRKAHGSTRDENVEVTVLGLAKSQQHVAAKCAAKTNEIYSRRLEKYFMLQSRHFRARSDCSPTNLAHNHWSHLFSGTPMQVVG
jgi:hypothetical protein